MMVLEFVECDLLGIQTAKRKDISEKECRHCTNAAHGTFQLSL